MIVRIIVSPGRLVLVLQIVEAKAASRTRPGMRPSDCQVLLGLYEIRGNYSRKLYEVKSGTAVFLKSL